MSRVMKVLAVVCVLLMVGLPALGGEHSLFYIYTALSKPLNLPGIYEFIAMGMLNDQVIDYYDSETQAKVPKQDWMREKMPQHYWEKGTQSRKSKEQWFKVNMDILMGRMGHNKSDLHVLQWRHGCVVDEDTDGNIKFVSGVDEYSYDGTEFLSFDEENSRWIAPVPAAVPTKRKWDDVPILNQYTKAYLEKECVDWLTKFMEYGKETLRNKSLPGVHVFVKKTLTSSSKLTLTCLVTDFYPRGVEVRVRKFQQSLPEHLVTSSGIRPNGDGTYQLRKSVEIMEDEQAQYDCFVTHSSINESIVMKLGEHSLFYIYTALSKPLNLPGIYEFIAMGMLNDQVIDYYDSETQAKVPKQDWMREKMPQHYWEKGTQSRKSKEQWFKVNMDILMERMGHNNSDLHVLQWRHGCVVDEDTDGNIKFVSGVDEYSYDGTEFLSFDEKNSRWIAPVPAAEPTKRKWDDVPILNLYTKGYLEKECVDWLKKFMEYGKETLRNKSLPGVHVFVKKTLTSSSKLTLTCLVTDFYPRGVEVRVRKFQKSLPEHLVTSSGIRPNGDGTYQLRKSVEIMEDEQAQYDCFVTHSSISESIVMKLDTRLKPEDLRAVIL
ncbi:uncharacterized protein LOC108274837 isoform X1 [Ictalurus punctatus]|uniref:Uncharacterized protein LOC108274837 isoform X1 n=1 Tax=Ictalurus punctatus TaxID=7998 RepID=A0A9F7RG47_ICTPU|nr:uncharacterized protein LOC108274837 isoform X1 [Ictalurus punctatus]